MRGFVKAAMLITAVMSLFILNMDVSATVTEEELYGADKGFGVEYDESGIEDKERYDDADVPAYKVIVNNNDSIAAVYSDSVIIQHLPYYLHTYFNLCSGRLNDFYRVTVEPSSVAFDAARHLVTMRAHADRYPDTELFIEYDTMAKAFGISSSMGDYSLEALGEMHNNPLVVDEDHDGNRRQKAYGDGDVYLSRHGDVTVNGWVYFNSNGLADTALNRKTTYSKTQVRKMLQWLDDMSGNYFRFVDTAVDDVYDWHVRTGYDPMPLFAILKTEGGVLTSKGRQYYNLGNIVGSPTIPGSRHGFKDCTGDVQNLVQQGRAKSEASAALILFLDDITHRYWEEKGQVTYYRMSFGGYGFDLYDYSLDKSRYPKDWDSAEKEAANFTHCYCPWWDDPAYLANLNSAKLWCNQCATFLEEVSARVGK